MYKNTGASIVLISIDKKVAMLLGISDKIKADAKKSIADLKDMGNLRYHNADRG